MKMICSRISKSKANILEQSTAKVFVMVRRHLHTLHAGFFDLQNPWTFTAGMILNGATYNGATYTLCTQAKPGVKKHTRAAPESLCSAHSSGPCTVVFFYFSTNGMPVRRSANGNTASGVLICVPLEMVNFRSEFDSIYCGRCPDARYYWKS